MLVVIPAAGYATRLFPLTENRPKALLEVKGKPILEHIIKRILELPGVEKIVVVSNDRYFNEFDKWAASFKCSVPLEVLNDGTKSNEDRLGQIGDIQLAVERQALGSDLLVIAGDNLFNFSLKPVYNFFMEKRAIVNALYDINDIGAARECGVMSIDRKTGMVVSFEEKPADPKTTNVSLGIYFFPKELVGELKAFLDSGGNPDKIGYLMAKLTKKKKLFAFVYREKWFDIGWHSALEKARNEFVP